MTTAFISQDDIEAALAGAKDRFDHAGAQYDPDVLALIRVAEAMHRALFGDDGVAFLKDYTRWLDSFGQLVPGPGDVDNDDANTDMVLHFLHERREKSNVPEPDTTSVPVDVP